MGVLSAVQTLFHRERPLVLIADDEPGIRDSLRKFLSRSGYMVETASNIEEALHCLFHRPVAAVILDLLFINAGGRSGLDILSSIRGDDRFAELPVILLTGHSPGPHVIAQIQAHRAEMWLKPVKYRELADRLDRLTGRAVPV